jgi:hypothetical protein
MTDMIGKECWTMLLARVFLKTSTEQISCASVCWKLLAGLCDVFAQA